MRTWLLLLWLSTAALRAGVPYFSEPALCPTRPGMAVVSGGEIWTEAAKGGEAHLLVSEPAEESGPLDSADCTKLAFVSTGAGDINILTLASGELKRLTFDDRLDQVLAWSRDPRRIYFANGTKLGKGVGEQTAGWIIYTGSVTLVDGTVMRMPQTVIRGADGKVMEAIRESYTGKDSQLDVAVKELLGQIGSK